ncbi:MAG: hypothetical protein IJU45_00205 [Clostridia bacterium]|nr:hypothetical protein [Clostridia bacterium]
MDKKKEQTIKTFGVTDDELELINKFSLKEMKSEDVYAFSVTLCDNEIDRDGERFDNNSLLKLKDLFLGVTGIFDHVHSSKNQTARIYYTEVVEDRNRLTSYGGKYMSLKARAYMPRSQGNAELIEKIDAGILKEVSVCCSVSGYICSVCGNDIRSEKCDHIKGMEYGGKVCHCVLSEPTDAYEWSFVAVPAQPEAGVTKTKVAKTFSECEKMFKSGRQTVIDSKLSKEFGKKLARLEKDAQAGREYRRDLSAQAVKYASLVLKDVDARVIEKICSSLEIDELKSLNDSLLKKAEDVVPLRPQLLAEAKDENEKNNNEFIF